MKSNPLRAFIGAFQYFADVCFSKSVCILVCLGVKSYLVPSFIISCRLSYLQHKNFSHQGYFTDRHSLKTIWTASSEFGTYHLCIRAVLPEPSLLAHTSSESRETFRQKARSLTPLNGLAWAVKIYHDGMLEDTNSLDGVHIRVKTI